MIFAQGGATSFRRRQVSKMHSPAYAVTALADEILLRDLQAIALGDQPEQGRLKITIGGRALCRGSAVVL
jgi:hypothetical protein